MLIARKEEARDLRARQRLMLGNLRNWGIGDSRQTNDKGWVRLLDHDEYDELSNSRTETAGPHEDATVAASEPQSSESAADQKQSPSAHTASAAQERGTHANELQQTPKSITLPGAPQAALPKQIRSGLSLPENLLTVPCMEATR